MADTPKPRQAPPKVAVPKLPLWQIKTPATPTRTESPKGTSRDDAISKPPQSLKLSSHVGARAKITNIRGQVLVGIIYSCEGELVLSTGPFDYHIIPLQKIVSCQIVPPKEPSPERARDDEAVKGKEREKHTKVREERLNKPPGVSGLGHKIFLMLGKTLPVRWHDKSIIVLDNVLIEPPYGVDNCRAQSKDVKQLERVRELVRNELEKAQKDIALGRRGA